MIRSFDLILDFSKETHPKLDCYGRFANAKAWYLSTVCGQVNTKCVGSTDKDRNFFLFQQTFHIVIQSDTLRTPGM